LLVPLLPQKIQLHSKVVKSDPKVIIYQGSSIHHVWSKWLWNDINPSAIVETPNDIFFFFYYFSNEDHLGTKRGTPTWGVVRRRRKSTSTSTQILEQKSVFETLTETHFEEIRANMCLTSILAKLGRELLNLNWLN